jgi:protein-L-isoaspartate O-methyltransferase
VLLDRLLPAPPARVLDVGGASGVYASWLSERGYQVHLIDPVPLHREQAMSDGRFEADAVTAELRRPDGSGSLAAGALSDVPGKEPGRHAPHSQPSRQVGIGQRAAHA